MLAITLVVASYTARRTADANIARGLQATGESVQGVMLGRERELVGKLALWVEPSTTRSALHVLGDSGSSSNVLDQVQEAAKSVGADWVQATNADGILIARSDRPGAAAQDISGSRLVSDALQGHAVAGFGVTQEGRVFEAVSVPILEDLSDSSRTYGALMASRYLDDRFARELSRITGSEIVLFMLPVDSAQPPQVVATSGTVRDTAQLSRTAKEWLSAKAMPPFAMGAGASVLSPEESNARPPAPAHLTVDGTEYVGQGRLLLSAAGQPIGGFLALRSVDAELAPFRRFRLVLVIAGLGGLLLSFALSGALAGRIARPVQALVDATQRASEGDYAASIPMSGDDEIGQLADSVRRLLADLREKQQLVDFLEGSSSGKTARSEYLGATMPMSAAGPALDVGSVIDGRYRITQVLGMGGMGMVYKAVDQALGEPVALKTLRPDLLAEDPTAVERFKSEIRLARKISHRNVVRTHDLGEASGMLFITMEYVEGRSLKELIGSRGRLPVHVVLPIARQLCRALEVAHEAGVIHRDIKPQNMVVEPDGVLKVMDFGIARLADRTTGYTQAGMVVGTPEYMSPEQLMGDDLDARADIYSAGAVLYECLTGRPPFEADSGITLIVKVLEQRPVPPDQLAPDVPAPLAAAVLRALARNRDERPRSAAELHDLIEQAAGTAAAGGGPASRPRAMAGSAG